MHFPEAGGLIQWDFGCSSWVLTFKACSESHAVGLMACSALSQYGKRPSCRSLGPCHELLKRLVSVVLAQQEDFFDVCLLEAHVVELDQEVKEFCCLQRDAE